MVKWLWVILLIAYLSFSYANEEQCQKDLAKAVGHPLVVVPLDFAKHFQHFRLHQQWHYLTHQYGKYLIGPLVKGPLPCGIIHLALPLQRTISLASAHLPFFEQLDLVDRLIGLSKVGDVRSTHIQQLWQQQKIREVGYPPPSELLLALNPDGLLLFYAPLLLRDLEAFKQFQAPKIILLEHEETHPLARLEWIKFFGVLYGKWERANEVYRTTKAEYLSWSQRARFSTQRPKVLMGSLSSENLWAAPAGNSYLAHLIGDAGGDYLWEQSSAQQMEKLNFEQVLQRAKKAVVWITLASWKSKQEMLAADARYLQLPAFRENRIFNFSTAPIQDPREVSWEQALGRPDEVLKDLIFIFHPEYLIDHQFYWARKIN